MENRDTSVARGYHEATKHSYASVRTDMHILDWAHQPNPFKEYPGARAVELPSPLSPRMPALRALGNPPSGGGLPLTLARLAEVLHFSAGLTRRTTLANGEEFFFRAAACAGGLYPIEVYLVGGILDGLAPGVYHYSPLHSTLEALREGDWRGNLGNICGDPSVAAASATLVLTAITWRSSWKYRGRSYRYHFWDAGTILANSLAVATAEGLPARLVVGFIDAELDGLLGLDGQREKSLVVVPLGSPGRAPAPIHPVPVLDLPADPVAEDEVVHPEIGSLHRGSALGDGDEVGRWRAPMPSAPRGSVGNEYKLPPTGREGDPLGDVILRRASSRVFHRHPISLDQFAAILGAMVPPPTDLPGGGTAAGAMVEPYLVVNAVDGLAPGSYHLDPPSARLEPLRLGDFREASGYLCLEQDLGADASAVVYLLADLGRVLGALGNRGYRAAQLEAGVLGGRLYLAAYGVGLGASGLTFYDDDVVEFFSPHAEGKDAMFVVALGKGARRRSPGLQRLAFGRTAPGIRR